jgi:hypothetical protein
MAIEKVVNVQVNIKGGAQTTAQVEKLNASLKRVKVTTGEVATGMKQSGNAVLENGGAMGLLNDLTGGYAMTVKDAVEASGLFTKGTTIASTAQKAYAMVVGSTTGALKALRIALVTTGLGALVVAIGYLVSKMGEASDATEELTADQERLNKQLEYTKELTDEVTRSLDYSTSAYLANAKKRGASDKELKKIEIDGINAKMKANTDEINTIKATQDQEYKLTAEQNKRIQDLRAQNLALLRQGRLSVLDFEAEQEVKQREKSKEEAEKSRAQTEKDREIEKQRIKDFNDSVAQGQRDLLDATYQANKEFEDEQIREKIDNAIKTQKALADVALVGDKLDEELAEKDKKRAEEKRIREEAVGNAKVDIALKTSELIRQIAGEDSKVGKGLAIAQATISGIEGVQNAFTTANKSPITVGFPAYPFIQAGLAGAFSLLQIKKIASTDPSGRSAGGSSSSSGGAQVPQAPSFNLVQGTGSNQIASGLANQRQAIQAYVVSGAVTNAQQLDRNIVNDASL